jgi:hypothetical protein
MGEMRNVYKILSGKLEGKSPLGIPWRRLEDNIRMDVREVGWDVVNGMHLARDRDKWRAFFYTVMNFRLQ